MARARKESASQQEFICPECGRTFARAAALGAHRRQAHGVAGASSRSRTAARRSNTTSASSATGRVGRRAAAARRPSPRPRVTVSSSEGRRRPAISADRDVLLKTLFPNGIPPKEEVIRAVNSWLDEAERLARMR